MKLAVIEAKKSRSDFKQIFAGSADTIDSLYMCSNEEVKKVLKKDVDLVFNADDYDYVVLVGSEAVKFYLGSTASPVNVSGTLFRDKYIPLLNPSMLYFKPELKPVLESSLDKIRQILSGEFQYKKITDDIAIGVNDTETAIRYIKEAFAFPVIAVDCETTSLYPRNGYVQGISIAWTEDFGIYISADCIDQEAEDLMRELFRTRKVVFHNGKFDRAMLTYHFNFVFPVYDDTMLLHYMVEEQPGTHGLKDLAAKHTPYGHYEEPLYDFINTTIKERGIKKSEFYWGWIPFEVMYPYAAMDSLVTFILWKKLHKAVYNNKKFVWVYENLLIKGSTFLQDIQDVGVPFSSERLDEAQEFMMDKVAGLKELLKADKTVQAFEREEGVEFNPGSVLQLRKLLFDYKGLKPTGRKTDKGLDSTDKEALEMLAALDPLAKTILEIRKTSKILNTYITKIKLGLDSDGRLRTNFNLTSTTSGRLSSSGKLNMQQLPRDEYRVKGCIKAAPGYKIVSLDLQTAEMYYAAVLSGDLALQDVFIKKGDFHSSIAKKVFNLPCAVEDVKSLYKIERQAAKAVSFGILYGAGAAKIAETVAKESKMPFSKAKAQGVINDYFVEFPTLKAWIDDNQKFIKENGYIYSALGRKRRLNKAKENGDMGEVRSGLNFLIQSLASDINLLGAIDVREELLTKPHVDARIFALVHDSIVAEVREDCIEEYSDILRRNVQRDRGVGIPGTPVGIDIEEGLDYSIGKYDENVGIDDDEEEDEE